MSKWARTVLVANLILITLVFIAIAHAQRPPELDSTGAAYMRVNINPTNVPPMVNINPGGNVPRVEVIRTPDIHIAPTGCQNGQNYVTGIGRSVSGPLMVSYLHLPPQQTTVTLNDRSGSHSMNLSQAGQITTSIFLASGQSLGFDSDVMYSGCRPE
ncbi:MAG TPA: hypothetical protein VGK48_22835 [Terriglobia bacterium]|jgi:hypothetical protein